MVGTAPCFPRLGRESWWQEQAKGTCDGIRIRTGEMSTSFIKVLGGGCLRSAQPGSLPQGGTLSLKFPHILKCSSLHEYTYASPSEFDNWFFTLFCSENPLIIYLEVTNYYKFSVCILLISVLVLHEPVTYSSKRGAMLRTILWVQYKRWAIRNIPWNSEKQSHFY